VELTRATRQRARRCGGRRPPCHQPRASQPPRS
jgi:hypothetical protein